MVDFGDGLTSFGIPIFGSLPIISGTYYFVNPDTTANSSANPYPGLDGNDGKSLKKPLKTLLAAYNKCVSGRGDGICLLSHGITSATTTAYLSASIDWSKWGITVVGKEASHMYGRARIANSGSFLALPYLIDVQGSNNAFYNLNIGNFGTDAAAIGGLKVSGNRNLFKQCHIVGAGATTPAALLTANSLYLSGYENIFDDTIIGTDTVDQDGSQIAGVINFAGGSERNRFRNCEILSWWSYASAVSGAIKHVGAGDSITRTQVFDNCNFVNYKLGLPTTTPPLSLVVGTAPNNGVVMLKNCSVLGYAAFDAQAANDRVYVTSPSANATGGLAVVTA